MKRLLAQLVLVVIAFGGSIHAAQTLDRIVATVNQKPILASDLEDEAHYEALQQAKAPDALEGNRKAVLNHVIERELICQQMAESYDPGKDRIDRQIALLRDEFPAVKTDQDWKSLIASYDFDEESLRDLVKLQLQVVHFIDLRLRPTVRVDRDEVDEYYSDKLVPKLKAAGAQVDPIDKLRDKIQEVLLQEKMTNVFEAWIANLRNQGSIRILDPTLVPQAGAGAEKSGNTSQ